MTKPKVLVIDIETSPHLGYFWGLFKQNIGIDQIIEPSRMICWAAKWSGTKGTEFGAEWQGEGIEWLERLHALIAEADAICHYNGETFDWPIIKREFHEAGLDPLPEPIQVDLLTTVRKFRLASNKLDWVAWRWLADRKKRTSFSLWVRVLEGDPKAQAEMEKYNRYDVVLTDKVKDDVLPYILNLPSAPLVAGAHIDTAVCPRCSSAKVQRRGYKYTKVSAFPRYQCQTCKGWFQGTVREHGTRVRAI